MTSGSEIFAQWRVLREDASGISELKAALKEMAKLIGRTRPNKSMEVEEEWAAHGLRVVSRPLERSGSCFVSEQGYSILVNSKEDKLRQRFTAAHEVAHLLLVLAKVAIPDHEREELCNMFAHHVLVPREELSAYMASIRSNDLEPDDLLRLCGVFNVNMRPMALAMAEQWRLEDRILLLADWRGHPSRPREEDLRVFAAGAPHRYYIPVNQRIASLGLKRLREAGISLKDSAMGTPSDSDLESGTAEITQASDAAARVPFVGFDEPVHLRARRSSPAPLNGETTGRVDWKMLARNTQHHFYLIAVMQTDLLETVWPTPAAHRRSGGVRHHKRLVDTSLTSRLDLA